MFQVQEMTTLIREAFINNLNSADWMDSATKEAAREKVRMSSIDYQDKEVKSVQKAGSLNFTGIGVTRCWYSTPLLHSIICIIFPF